MQTVTRWMTSSGSGTAALLAPPKVFLYFFLLYPKVVFAIVQMKVMDTAHDHLSIVMNWSQAAQ